MNFKWKWVIPALLGFVTFSSPAWAIENLCPYAGQHNDELAQVLNVDPETAGQIAAIHCSNVGRRAYNALGTDRIRSIYLGPIQRVLWVEPGDIISQPGAKPRIVRSAGILYMIGPGGVADHIFYRWGSEIAEEANIPEGTHLAEVK